MQTVKIVLCKTTDLKSLKFCRQHQFHSKIILFLKEMLSSIANRLLVTVLESKIKILQF